MTASRGRHVFVRARSGVGRAVNAVRHPLWTTGTVVRGLAAGARAGRGAPRGRRISCAACFRCVSPRRSAAGRTGPIETIAIRWIGPVNLRHEVREALLVPSASRRRIPHARPGALDLRLRLRAVAAGLAGSSAAGRIHRQRRRSTVFASVSTWTHGAARRDSRSIRARAGPIGAGTGSRSSCRAVDEPRVDVVVTLSTRVAGAGERRQRLGPLRRAALRVAASARRGAELGRHVRGARPHRRHPPVARAAAGRPASPRRMPRPIRAGSRSTRATKPRSTRCGSEVAALPRQPLISIVTPVYNTDPRWLRACDRIGPPPGLSELAALPVRRRVDVARNHRRRCASTEGDPRITDALPRRSTAASRRRRTPRSSSPTANSSRCSIMTTS